MLGSMACASEREAPSEGSARGAEIPTEATPLTMDGGAQGRGSGGRDGSADPPGAVPMQAAPSGDPSVDAAVAPDGGTAEAPSLDYPIEPRFLITSEGEHYMRLLDRSGATVRDFGGLVDVGAGHEGVRLSVDGFVAELVAPTRGGGTVWFNHFPLGDPQYWRGLRPSRPMVLRVPRSARS